jgi:hypothetical protein
MGGLCGCVAMVGADTYDMICDSNNCTCLKNSGMTGRFTGGQATCDGGTPQMQADFTAQCMCGE